MEKDLSSAGDLSWKQNAPITLQSNATKSKIAKRKTMQIRIFRHPKPKYQNINPMQLLFSVPYTDSTKRLNNTLNRLLSNTSYAQKNLIPDAKMSTKNVESSAVENICKQSYPLHVKKQDNRQGKGIIRHIVSKGKHTVLIG